MASLQRHIAEMTVGPGHAAERLADFALAVDAQKLPPQVVDKAVGCLTDFLSCALTARDLPWGRQVLEYARIGPRGPVTVIGTDFAVGSGEAAFVNATLGHALIREDMHVASCSHLGVVVWPTLLALAELKGARGDDLVGASVVGYEVGARIGWALFDVDLATKIRPTGTVGAIGAAAAGCRLLGLSRAETISAIGFAANTASGLNEWPWAGGTEVFFHAGFAARSAVTAVLLAQCGAFASPTAIDGRAGLFASHGRRDRADTIQPLSDGAYEIMSVYWKPAPACNYVQTPCQAALALVRKGVRAEDVRRVHVHSFMSAIQYPGCNQPGPFSSALAAKMSIQFSVAATLVRGAIEEANYARLDDPEILRLAGATELRVDPRLEAAYPAKQGVELTVLLADGVEHSVRCDDVTPVDLAGVRGRFEAAAHACLGPQRAAALASAIDNLTAGGDAAAVAKCAGTA